MTLHIGMLLFPRLTQLDLTGPFEIVSRLPDARVHLVWKDLDPIRTDTGLGMLPTTTMRDCPQLDVLFVPGGGGQNSLLDDGMTLEFLRTQAESARYVTSVCTGSLLLGAAGLLAGYKATTHWAFLDLLPLFGAHPTEGRVVIDRNRITAGGITAGIDFGLRIAAELVNEEFARGVELMLQYDPEPPFGCGHPRRADAALVARVQERLSINERRERVRALIASGRLPNHATPETSPPQ
jgi:cyclohexyl-isocyanide hydratase